MTSKSTKNVALDRMRAGEVALGMLVRLSRTTEIARVASASGHDFIFVDTQHGLFSIETIGAIAHAAMGCGISTFVRVRGSDDSDMLRLLDAGVAGIVVPDVNTADEARAAVRRVKFPPLGRRSVSSGYTAFNYEGLPTARLTEEMNLGTALVCMIETREGLRNVDEIAQIPGVDILHVGCNDLLVEMGKPGQFGDPEIMDAVATVIATCRRHGKIAGLGGDRDLARQAKIIHDGVRFVTTQSDLAFLLNEATRRVSDIRGTLAATN